MRDRIIAWVRQMRDYPDVDRDGYYRIGYEDALDDVIEGLEERRDEE